MVSRLVLVRHAKAQDSEAGLPDAQRRLTVAGRASIEARYPSTFALLADDNSQIQVWSSPAIRATQTAEVVAEAVGVEDFAIKDVLISGDADAFLTALSAEEGTVIAVGHNPFMEELFEQLSGFDQELKPGAVGSFGFKASGDSVAEQAVWLEWFVQAPRVSFWQTLVNLEEGLIDAAERLDRCDRALLGNIDDPESLHQYRVALEIAHALLCFVKPYVKGKPLRRALRDIEELLRRSYRIRDFDVLMESVDERAPEALTLRDAAMREREAFHERFSSEPVQEVVTRIADTLRYIPWKSATLRSGLSSRSLAERAAKMQLSFESELARVPFDVQDEVLDLRKQARALQYVLRAFEDCLPDNAAANAMRAQAVQERLGELCDCWINARFIVAVCGPTAITAASRFVMRADAIAEDFKTTRKYGLEMSDS